MLGSPAEALGARQGAALPGDPRAGCGPDQGVLGAAEDGQRGEHLGKQRRGQPSPLGPLHPTAGGAGSEPDDMVLPISQRGKLRLASGTQRHPVRVQKPVPHRVSGLRAGVGQVAGKGSGRAPPLRCAPDLPGSLPSIPPPAPCPADTSVARTPPKLPVPTPPPRHTPPQDFVFTWAPGPRVASPPPPRVSRQGSGGQGLLTRPCHRPSGGPAMLQLPGAHGGVQLRHHRHVQGQRNHVQDDPLLAGDGSVCGRAGLRRGQCGLPARTTPVRWPCAWPRGHSRVLVGGQGAGHRGSETGWRPTGGPAGGTRPDAGAPCPQCTPSWGTPR